MGKLLGSWFGKDAERGPARVNETYVSEFTDFINHFLEDHPEVSEDQKAGRLIYWDKKIDPATLLTVDTDGVPDDGYGFYYRAWSRNAGEQPSPRREKTGSG